MNMLLTVLLNDTVKNKWTTTFNWHWLDGRQHWRKRIKKRRRRKARNQFERKRTWNPQKCVNNWYIFFFVFFANLNLISGLNVKCETTHNTTTVAKKPLNNCLFADHTTEYRKSYRFSFFEISFSLCLANLIVSHWSKQPKRNEKFIWAAEYFYLAFCLASAVWSVVAMRQEFGTHFINTIAYRTFDCWSNKMFNFLPSVRPLRRRNVLHQ